MSRAYWPLTQAVADRAQRRPIFWLLVGIFFLFALSETHAADRTKKSKRKIKRNDEVTNTIVIRKRILVSAATGTPQGTKATAEQCDAKPVMLEPEELPDGSYILHEGTPMVGLVELLGDKSATLDFPEAGGWQVCESYCGDAPPRDALQARRQCIWVDANYVQLEIVAGDISWWLAQVHARRAQPFGYYFVNDNDAEVLCTVKQHVNATAMDGLIRGRFRVDFGARILRTRYNSERCDLQVTKLEF